MNHIVGLIRAEEAVYPALAPYDLPNGAGKAVEHLFTLLGYDAAKSGTPEWNPLGWLIRPGETVFIKPNMIAHKHRYTDEWEHVITHGSVIRAVVDFVYRALEGRGKILVGDAPQTDSEWGRIVERMGLNALRDEYRRERNFEIELIDLRDEHWIERDGVYINREKLPGDPRGGAVFDLGARSALAELDGQGRKYYGAFYDIDETNRHHSAGKHEYAVSRSPLEADVFISIPKLKTHKKCGITVNLKGLVGINANKNWLPHYAFGSPESGGDQFDRARAAGRIENALVVSVKQAILDNNNAVRWLARKGKQLAYRIFGDTEKVVRSGNWHGNDTVWRMCVDLNRVLLYGNPDGTWRKAGSRKRYFSVVDGVVAMEGNGPVAGTPRAAGVLLAGTNPVAVDAVCAQLMGFDYRKLALVARAFEPHEWPLSEYAFDDIRVLSNEPQWQGAPSQWSVANTLRFKPHFGWEGSIELTI